MESFNKDTGTAQPQNTNSVSLLKFENWWDIGTFAIYI